MPSNSRRMLKVISSKYEKVGMGEFDMRKKNWKCSDKIFEEKVREISGAKAKTRQELCTREKIFQNLAVMYVKDE